MTRCIFSDFQAKKVDARLAAGEALHILAGIPLAIKDNICRQGVSTTAGSTLLRKHLSTYDAEVVSGLKARDCVLLGQTNMDEFGMGNTTETGLGPPTRNPWNASHVPGGSSGGSAAAVAAQMCAGALGSDTGGSIRQPASFCGVVGLKPTYGTVSRHGLVAYCSSFDTIGPIGPTVEDVSYLFQAIKGDLKSMKYDTSLRRSGDRKPLSFLEESQLPSRPLQGRRFAVIAEALGPGVSTEVRSAFLESVKHIEGIGGIVDLVTSRTFQRGLPAYYVIALSEASSNLARFDGTRFGSASFTQQILESYTELRQDTLGEEVRRRILMGTYMLSSGYSDEYYTRAKCAQKQVCDELVGYLSNYDALLTPATPDLAYIVGEKTKNPLQMYAGDLMTVNINLSGLPAIVVRSCEPESNPSQRLPIGIQFIGKHFCENELLEIAHTFETSQNTRKKFPEDDMLSNL